MELFINLTENQKEWFVSALNEMIDEHKVTADNERLWASGTSDKEQRSMHIENADEHIEFVDFLNLLKDAVRVV